MTFGLMFDILKSHDKKIWQGCSLKTKYLLEVEFSRFCLKKQLNSTFSGTQNGGANNGY